MAESIDQGVKNKYQDLLFRLPIDWPKKRVSEIGAVIGGGTPSRDACTFWNGKIPWVTPGEVSGESKKCLAMTNEYITAAGLAGSGARLLPAGSLMVTTRATLGARAINAVPMATNQGFKSIVFRRPEDASFYFHFFDKVKPELARRASGTTFLEISGSEFSDIVVPNPHEQEKQKIADVLDTLDVAIAETDFLVAKLKAAKQGLLHDLLTRGVDANGELRSVQADAPDLYKPSLLGWIPRQWSPMVLDQLVDQRRPIVYGILMPGQWYEGGVPVIKVKNIIGGVVELDDLLLTSPAIDGEYKRSKLRPGDLLFTIRGTVGRTAFVPECLDGANITQDTARLSISGVDARFVRHYLDMPVSSGFIAVHTLGVAVQGINLRDVRRIPIAVPTPAEAKLIADKIEIFEIQILEEQKKLEKLRVQKQGLMDDLLTGRVRVTPLLNPPATA